MTTDTSLQKFMIITGVPGSGKSTAINLLIDAVGSENVSCALKEQERAAFKQATLEENAVFAENNSK